MLFNSIDFAIFLPIVFILYWFVFKNKHQQNILIAIASYVFYGWWDWRFLILILFSTIVDYLIGITLNKADTQRNRKLLLLSSLVINLGLLGFFKYFNFFIDNFTNAFSFFGYHFDGWMLNIILPVGISFYTFQTLSYTLDVYRNKIKPTKHFISFAAFVSFFPQLVAGPIERASHLLPQFETERKFKYDLAVNGLRQILWGLFKKVVIADNCARFANIIFSQSDNLNGSTLILGALFFTFQIYGDFSGYSDIAIGTSRLFGFDLMKNFNFPYFSRDMAEFWRRWHISLSTWFRDYLYIPLGGSIGSLAFKIKNIFIIFIVSGFWHGANWTFIFWGALNALYFLPLLVLNKNRDNLNTVAQNSYFPTFRELISISVTFALTVFAWIFFRADNLTHAFSYIDGIFSFSIFQIPNFSGIGLIIPTIILTVIFMIIEWIGREDEFAIEKVCSENKILRYGLFYFIIVTIILFKGPQQDFIYFQF